MRSTRFASLQLKRTWTIRRVNRYHVTISRIFSKVEKTPDGDGNLLDHSMVLYGSAMSDGNQHNHDPLPVILAGGAIRQTEGRPPYPQCADTTMSNLLVSMADMLGVHMDKFGDSTGMLSI